MNDERKNGRDEIQKVAWSWVLRQHDQGSLDEAEERELACWLCSDDAHRRAFEEANRLWLAAGLLPPAHEAVSPETGQPAGPEGDLDG